MRIPLLLADLSRFPWKSTALTLRERFREDQLGLTASSLTFTTSIALVPFFTVALAIFTAFPMFNQLQASLEAWLVQSLVPPAISKQVLGYLTQFSGRASRLGTVGLAILLAAALALVLTIDRTLNKIWRVRRPRPLGQRVMIYWAAVTLGPLVLATSISITSYAITASRGFVGTSLGMLPTLLAMVEFVLLAAGLSALYRFVPNTPVRPTHAITGGVIAAIGVELAKRGLTLYFAKVPTYSAVYGAFATLPILLVWIYIAWVIVLLGAVIAAYMPSLLVGARRRPGGAGWQFELALEALRHLNLARSTVQHGLTMQQLSAATEADELQLEPVLDALVQLDWVARINEQTDGAETRYVLLAEPAVTSIEPLAKQMLLPRNAATERFWRNGGLAKICLKDVV
ncbi:YihY family inner membrane protein [Ramlibacter albus]|uniref:UPF0761 membrane protein H8R02_20955 n=1 Tax=Ramlibacter albus TaxID=2079448 RepID=A0A923MCL8_9BURK|nr:YihY family inner membrane protein [Ramlibacter albus]MBC5766948.1 YihY family inner membrane protein [Ramlibacter albus]